MHSTNAGGKRFHVGIILGRILAHNFAVEFSLGPRLVKRITQHRMFRHWGVDPFLQTCLFHY